MLALMIIISAIVSFMGFIILGTTLFNATIKKCSLYRRRSLKKDKLFHNLYTMAYSAIFSVMLMASVFFPFFVSNFYQPINIDIPTIQTIIVDSAEELLEELQTTGDVNIFNELNKISIRFENEQVFKN